MSAVVSENRSFFNQLRKYYSVYTGGFIWAAPLTAHAYRLVGRPESFDRKR